MTVQAVLRGDHRAVQSWRSDHRSPERLCAHYILERRLSEELRAASRLERPLVYAKVYDELYAALYDHPKRSSRRDPRDVKIVRQVSQIAPYLNRDGVFVELGCGDSALCLAVARRMREVVGIDVQDQLIDSAILPSNYRFVRSLDGVCLPLAADSVDVVFSDQLMEHIHPDDAVLQLSEIKRILRKGGMYICSTPSSLTGPHDISMYFSYVAEGLHLKEYNYEEMLRLFQKLEFSEITFFLYTKFGKIPLPAAIGVGMERIFRSFPTAGRARLARTRLAERLFGINLVATK